MDPTLYIPLNHIFNHSFHFFFCYSHNLNHSLYCQKQTKNIIIKATKHKLGLKLWDGGSIFLVHYPCNMFFQWVNNFLFWDFFFVCGMQAKYPMAIKHRWICNIILCYPWKKMKAKIHPSYVLQRSFAGILSVNLSAFLGQIAFKSVIFIKWVM